MFYVFLKIFHFFLIITNNIRIFVSKLFFDIKHNALLGELAHPSDLGSEVSQFESEAEYNVDLMCIAPVVELAVTTGLSPVARNGRVSSSLTRSTIKILYAEDSHQFSINPLMKVAKQSD